MVGLAVLLVQCLFLQLNNREKLGHVCRIHNTAKSMHSVFPLNISVIIDVLQQLCGA